MPDKPARAIALRSDRFIPSGPCAPAAWGEVGSGFFRERVRALAHWVTRICAAPPEGGRALLSEVPSAEELGDKLEFTGFWLDRSGDFDRLCFTARREGAVLGLLASERRADGGAWSRPRVLLAPEGPPGVRDMASPCMLGSEQGWRIWYAAYDGAAWRVHCAHSPDWITAEPLGVALDVGAFGTGDETGVLDPCVAATDDTLIMAYCATQSGAIDVAVCRGDGTGSWEKCGPMLFRGAPGRPDDRGMRSPVLIPSADGRHLDLEYIGIDRHGRRSLMRVPSFLDSESLPSPAPISAIPTEAVARAMESIPRRALALQLEAEKDARPFVDRERGIEQLAGSSTPVFVIDVSGGKRVVKAGRAPDFVEREFDRGRVAARFLPTVRTDLLYVRGQPLLVSDYVAGPAVADLALTDPRAFGAVLRRVLSDSVRLWSNTLIPYDQRLVEFTPHPPAKLIRLLTAAASRAAPEFSLSLTVNGEDLGVSLAEVAMALAGAIAQRPKWLAFANGDAQLNHYRLSPAGVPLALDMEYAGWFDLDFAAYPPCMGLVRDRPIFDGLSLELRANAVRLYYELADPALRKLVSARTFADAWKALPIRPERVLAYTFAMLLRESRLYGEPRSELARASGMAQLAEVVCWLDDLDLLRRLIEVPSGAATCR
jgi:hypothetical protein